MADPFWWKNEKPWTDKGDVSDIKRGNWGGLAGLGGTDYGEVTFENGETWQIFDDPTMQPRMLDLDPPMATAWRAANKEPSPIFRELPDGSIGMWDKETQTFKIVSQDPEDQSQDDLKAAQAEYYRRQAANVGAATPYRAGEYEEQQLRNEKARRDLMNPYVSMQQQAYEAIDALGNDLSLKPEERQKRIDLIINNMTAGFEGTTPFEKKKQQQGLASNLIGDRMSTANSMAQGLFSTLGSGAYGKILSSRNPPTNFNPLTMGMNFASDAGGGAELGELAKAILSGAFKGGL